MIVVPPHPQNPCRALVVHCKRQISPVIDRRSVHSVPCHSPKVSWHLTSRDLDQDKLSPKKTNKKKTYAERRALTAQSLL